MAGNGGRRRSSRLWATPAATLPAIGTAVSQVLRGTSPSEIPVEQPTQFELVLNLQAAKAIGHEIPAGLVLRADKLIE